MRRIAIILCILTVGSFWLVSCGSGEPDGVLIVPSSRGEAVTSEVITFADTEPTGTAEPVTEAISVETEEPAAETADPAAASDPDGMLAAAQELIDDPAFRERLKQYGVGDADRETLLGTVAAVLACRDKMAVSGEDALVSGENTVFWTDGGSVWHVTENCSALAKSKTVLSGSREEAMADGKTRVCKRCGD